MSAPPSVVALFGQPVSCHVTTYAEHGLPTTDVAAPHSGGGCSACGGTPKDVGATWQGEQMSHQALGYIASH